MLPVVLAVVVLSGVVVMVVVLSDFVASVLWFPLLYFLELWYRW